MTAISRGDHASSKRAEAAEDLPAGIFPGCFVRRLNRFAAEVEVSGSLQRCHLANPARMYDLLVADAEMLLRQTSDPARKTGWTVVRIRHAGVWVGMEAVAANEAFAEYLARPDSGAFGTVTGVYREVRIGRHRIDFRVHTETGVWIVETKSLGWVEGDVAFFSGTPSVRGAAHLELLSRLHAEGADTAAAFVIQRPDARVLRPGPRSDPGWIAAVREARLAGVRILAFRCDVTPVSVHIAEEIPVEV